MTVSQLRIGYFESVVIHLYILTPIPFGGMRTLLLLRISASGIVSAAKLE